MTMKIEYRAGVTMGAVIAASLTLSGCLGPTYGTDKTAGAQLIDDLGNIASIGAPRKGADIEYKPRPAIVKPAGAPDLPAPQQNVVENNPQWVESPEQTRQRLREEAAVNSGNTTYTSPLAKKSAPVELKTDHKGRRLVGRAAEAPATMTTVAEQRRAYQERRKSENVASSGRRRYLSEPPVTYRQPAETAAVGDLGESERAKEKRWKEEAAKEGTGKRKWWPW